MTRPWHQLSFQDYLPLKFVGTCQIMLCSACYDLQDTAQILAFAHRKANVKPRVKVNLPGNDQVAKLEVADMPLAVLAPKGCHHLSLGSCSTTCTWMEISSI